MKYFAATMRVLGYSAMHGLRGGSPMPALVLKLLGGFEASLGHGPPLPLPTKTGQALLAYLALTPELRHSRDKLAVLLWEDRAEPQARTSLRQTLAVLRKAIQLADIPWLCADGNSIALIPARRRRSGWRTAGPQSTACSATASQTVRLAVRGCAPRTVGIAARGFSR